MGDVRSAARLFLGIFVSCCAIVVSMGEVRAAPSPRDDKKVAEALQEPQGNPKSAELNERGVAAVRAKDTRLAEELFRKALEADPKNLSAVFNLSGMLLTNQKEREAITLLETYTSDNPSDGGMWGRLGDAYFASKDVKRAQHAYEKALAIDPTLAAVPARLATVYTLTNQLEKAEQILYVAVEQNPRDSQLLANLSSVFLANGKTDKAISAAKRAIQLKPTKELYVTLGTAYEIMQDLPNSLIAFQRARDLGDTRSELDAKIEALSKQVQSSKS